jgi:hypothetical protein
LRLNKIPNFAPLNFIVVFFEIVFFFRHIILYRLIETLQKDVGGDWVIFRN